jgi:hypothetical protein
MSTKKAFKSKAITIRITEEEDVILNGICEQLKIAKSDLIRNSINRYITTRPGDPIRKIIFEKEIMRKLMELATDEMLQQFAETEFKYGMADDIVDRIVNPDLTTKPKAEQFIYHVSMNVEYVLSERGQNWFEKIDFTQTGDRIKIMGNHGLGKNFSKFIKYLFGAYAKHFGCELIDETIWEDTVLLSFKLK